MERQRDLEKRREHQKKEASVMGMWLLIGAEVMFFAGLLFAYFILLKLNTAQTVEEIKNSKLLLLCGTQGRVPLKGNYWLPESLKLPVVVTAVNTGLLLVSALFMQLATGSIAKGNRKRSSVWLILTALLGTTFVVVQGYEWAGLLHHGLTVGTSVFGAIFYTIIGAHGIHVIGGLMLLLFSLFQILSGRYSAQNHLQLRISRIYWFFVVFLWPALYFLLYFQ